MSAGSELLWANTIGRVAFMNCDPLFLGLDPTFNVPTSAPFLVNRASTEKRLCACSDTSS